jgi:hypothetical protein
MSCADRREIELRDQKAGHVAAGAAGDGSLRHNFDRFVGWEGLEKLSGGGRRRGER